MPRALFIVTVPAKVVVVKGGAKSSDDGDLSKPAASMDTVTSSSVTPVAAQVREFIVNKDNGCRWISEEPFLNGKAWWTRYGCKKEAADRHETRQDGYYSLSVVVMQLYVYVPFWQRRRLRESSM